MLNSNYGLFSLVGGVIIHITLGTFYTWGNLSNYIISTIRYFKSDNPPRLNDAAILVSALLSGQALAMSAGGFIGKKYGARLAVALGAVVMCSGAYFAQFTLHNYFLFVLTYGLLYGLGIGLAYNSPINCAHLWFPNNKGLVTGIITAGFGSGALIFNQVHRSYVNPENLSPAFAPYEEKPNELYYNDEALIERVTHLFTYISIIYLALYTIGGILLFAPPSPETLHKNDEERFPLLRNSNKVVGDSMHFTVMEALKSPKLYALMFIFFLNGTAISFVASFWKIVATEESVHYISLSDKQLSWIGSLGSMANALGRIGWGIYIDNYGFSSAIGLLSIFWAMLIIVMPFSARYGAFVYGASIFCNFFCLGGNFSLFPAAVAKVFGNSNFGVIYGVFFMAQIGSSILTGVFSKQFYSSLGPVIMSLMIGLCCVMARASLYVFQRYKLNLDKLEKKADASAVPHSA